MLQVTSRPRRREGLDASIMEEDRAITVAGPVAAPQPVPAAAPAVPVAEAKPPPSVPAAEPVAAEAPPLPSYLGQPMPKPVEDLDATIMLQDSAITGVIHVLVPQPVPAAEPVAAAAPPLLRYLGLLTPKPVEDLDATIMVQDSAIAGVISPGRQQLDVDAEAITKPNSPETSSSLGSLRLSNSDEEVQQGSQSGGPEEEAEAQVVMVTTAQRGGEVITQVIIFFFVMS